MLGFADYCWINPKEIKRRQHKSTDKEDVQIREGVEIKYSGGDNGNTQNRLYLILEAKSEWSKGR